MKSSAKTIRTNAFSLIESFVASAIVGIFFVTLYTGITQSFSIMNNAREDLRANQILLDKMEDMRLYSWDQINSFGTRESFIPADFTEEYFPRSTNSLGATTSTDGFLYYGTVLVTNVNFTNTAYTSKMRQIIVNVRWTNGAKAFDHQMTTYVSQYGLQKYIY